MNHLRTTRFGIKISMAFVVLLFLSATGYSLASSPVVKTKDGKGFVPLFDGKSLDGWIQRGGKAKYKVADGMIVGTTVPNTPNSFLCTKQNYADFILEVEYKVDPKMNSGIQIRSNSIPTFRRGVVHGYQVEIDPSKRAWSGGIYDESRRGWINDLKNNSKARGAFRQNKWNHYRIECRGDSIKTWINGVAAADLVDSATQTGFIALQVHGYRGTEPISVMWRNIRIRDLGQHTWEPIFDGKSLSGFTPEGGGKWTVEEGQIVGRSSKNNPSHGHLFSDKEYTDFTIRMQYKAVTGNSGFYFRTEKRGGNVGIKGFQAEISPEGDAGGLYETNGRAWVSKPKAEDVKKYFKPGKWNQMTVSAHGRRIVVHVNGTKTADLKNDPGRLKGFLAVQLHGGQEMEVYFKNIEQLVPATK